MKTGFNSGLAIGAIAASCIAGGVVFAASPTTQVITACVNQSTGVMRMVENCTVGETRISWNVQGQAGPRGANGLKGDRGERGFAGPQGPSGPKGPIGVQGVQGPTGPKGNQGPRGDTGLIGPVGPQGVIGPRGPKGDTGSQGPQGETGSQGPAGKDAELPTGFLIKAPLRATGQYNGRMGQMYEVVCPSGFEPVGELAWSEGSGGTGWLMFGAGAGICAKTS